MGEHVTALSRRAILRSAALGGAAAALAACAGPGWQTAPAPGVTPTGTVEFWQWGVSYVDGFNQLTGEFNELTPGAKVVPSQPTDYDNKVTVTLAAGAGGPDVYLITGPNYKKWAHDGLAADVTSYVSRDKAAAADLKAMLTATVEYYTTGHGKLQGVPWDLSTISVAYNLEELARRGLQPPAELGAQWDWAAFLDYAKRLTPGDGSRYGVNADPGIERGWYNWAVANGGKLFADDFTRCAIDSAEAVDALDTYMSVANRLHAAPPLDWLSQQSQGQPHAAYQLITGLVNMQTAGDWFFGWYGKVPGFRWDVAPMPVSPRTKKTASIANMRGVVLSPLAQHRDLAWAWIARMMSRPVQDRIPALMGELPARTDSIDQVYLNPEKAPTPKSRRLLKAAIEATVPLPGHPLLPWSGDGSVSTTTNVNDVYEGRKEAKAALADIQDKMNALIGAAKQ